MQIKLISKKQFETIKNICADRPALTLENKGYETIKKDLLSAADLQAFSVVSGILADHIIGFSEFNNFCTNKRGGISLRFQYNYGAEDQSMSFTGVGYISLNELLNGFNK